jgi:mRNA-degrading endonuclease toxin of MazEF toxin-antitoxin module
MKGSTHVHQQADKQSPDNSSAANTSRLHPNAGDTIAYTIVGQKVILTRAPIEAADDPFANFEEWSSEADRPVRERRPALVVASENIQEHHGLLWVMMITSSKNRGWPGNVVVSDLTVSGLPVASMVRAAKITTIEARESERIGRHSHPGPCGQIQIL